MPVEVSLDLARMVSEHQTLSDAVGTLNAIAPEVIAYACTSGSFVGGVMGERAMCEAMSRAGGRTGASPPRAGCWKPWWSWT
ncbi:hypothetical protein SVIOM74S_02443 [Streptomyces violarus]